MGHNGNGEGARAPRRASVLSKPAAYFDAVALKYGSRYAATSPGGLALRVRKERTLELLQSPGGKVLDVGCGPGVLFDGLLNLDCEVWGVDPAPNMIEQCRTHFGNHPRVHAAVADATSLPFPSEFFDAVTCLGVIDFVQASDSAISEMVRVVKKDGTILVSFSNLLSPYTAWRNFVFYPTVRLVRPAYYRLARRPPPASLLAVDRRLYTVDAATALIHKHGATVIHVTHCYFNIALSPLDEFFPRWAMKMTESLEQLRFGMLKWLGGAFIVKATKH